MSNPIVLAGISLLWPAIALAITGIIGAGVLAAIRFFSAHPKTVPLADVVNICGQALEAAVKSAGGLNATAIANAEKAAFNVLAAHKTDLEADALAELKALCSHTVALKAGIPLVVTAPGGAGVAMPTRAFIGLLFLPALLALALAALLVGAGIAKGETPPLVDSARGTGSVQARPAFPGHSEVLADARLRQNAPAWVPCGLFDGRPYDCHLAWAGELGPVDGSESNRWLVAAEVAPAVAEAPGSSPAPDRGPVEGGAGQLAPAASPAPAVAQAPAQTVYEAAALLGAERLVLKSAIDQIEKPAIIDHWEAGILTPGLRFTLTGAAPASVATGSGVDFNYLFGKYLYTTKQIDPVTTLPIKIPWFGVSLFAQGAVDFLFSGTPTESENAAIGAGIILLNQITIGWFVDLILTGAGGPTGILTGKLSLANTGPEVFYSVTLGEL